MLKHCRRATLATAVVCATTLERSTSSLLEAAQMAGLLRGERRPFRQRCATPLPGFCFQNTYIDERCDEHGDENECDPRFWVLVPMMSDTLIAHAAVKMRFPLLGTGADDVQHIFTAASFCVRSLFRRTNRSSSACVLHGSVACVLA